MNTIEQHAEHILQSDLIGFRRKAAQSVIINKREECVEILLDIANLCSLFREELNNSELLERIYQSAFWLNQQAKEEAIIYARKEQELAEINKTIFFPEETQQ